MLCRNTLVCFSLELADIRILFKPIQERRKAAVLCNTCTKLCCYRHILSFIFLHKQNTVQLLLSPHDGCSYSYVVFSELVKFFFWKQQAQCVSDKYSKYNWLLFAMMIIHHMAIAQNWIIHHKWTQSRCYHSKGCGDVLYWGTPWDREGKFFHSFIVVSLSRKQHNGQGRYSTFPSKFS